MNKIEHFSKVSLYLGTSGYGLRVLHTRLIQELGAEEFILQSGCDIPANARLEDVHAMVAAATD